MLGLRKPVLVGTIFYAGQRLVRGGRLKFDRSRAEELIARQQELAERTGVECMLDVVLLSTREVAPYIDFVAGVTDAPFAAGAAREEVRAAAARYVAEVGLQERYLHSSLSLLSGNPGKEVRLLGELGIRSALLLVHSEREGERVRQAEALVELVSPHLPHLAVDLGMVSLGEAMRVLREGMEIRRLLGVEVGCAPSNATHLVRERVAAACGSMGFTGFDAAIHGISAMYCDFLLYGAIEHAPWIFPAVAGALSLTRGRSRGFPF